MYLVLAVTGEFNERSEITSFTTKIVLIFLLVVSFRTERNWIVFVDSVAYLVHYHSPMYWEISFYSLWPASGYCELIVATEKNQQWQLLGSYMNCAQDSGPRSSDYWHSVIFLTRNQLYFAWKHPAKSLGKKSLTISWESGQKWALVIAVVCI